MQVGVANKWYPPGCQAGHTGSVVAERIKGSVFFTDNCFLTRLFYLLDTLVLNPHHYNWKWLENGRARGRDGMLAKLQLSARHFF